MTELIRNFFSQMDPIKHVEFAELFDEWNDGNIELRPLENIVTNEEQMRIKNFMVEIGEFKNKMI